MLLLLLYINLITVSVYKYASQINSFCFNSLFTIPFFLQYHFFISEFQKVTTRKSVNKEIEDLSMGYSKISFTIQISDPIPTFFVSK